MKKIILSVALLLTGLANAQDSIFNNKSIDFGVGVANILSPGSGTGYDGKYLDPLSLNIGYRVMLNRDFGVSANLAYNNFTGKSVIKNVNANFYSFSLNGFLNLRSFLNFGEFSNKFGLLGHMGAGASANTIAEGKGYKSNTRDLAIFVNAGLMPQYKVNDKLAINLDFVLNLQKMQQLTLDMQSAKNDVGLGKYFGTATIGVNYYCFGSKKDKTHADWAPKFDKNKSEIEALKNRVKIVENKLADTDRDGVADYLDLEPNTPEGSIVNTHGQKVVDSDGDGIEDTQDFCPTVKGTSEFKGCPQAITGSANNEQGKPVEGQLKYDIQKFTTDINFETKSTSIKPASKKQLDGLAKILSTNTNLIIQLNGHCDNIGEDILNNKLSLDRANSVKAYLVSKGVNAASIITKGFGTLKPKQSNETEKGRSANRRVDFEVKSK
jgi:OOP family OmpA-OmpF porin